MDKKEARKALRKSIKHWCIDIRKPLILGDSIIFGSTWKKNGNEVKMYSRSCEL